MPNYYCEYCKSSLTHNSLSVRKSHLIGKNHLRYYCEYYENEAKKLDLLSDKSDELPYEMTIDELYKGIPGAKPVANSEIEEPVEGRRPIRGIPHQEIHIRSLPPPSLASFPAPPPSVYHHNITETKKGIQEAMRQHSERKK